MATAQSNSGPYRENLGGNFAGSIVLHLAVFGAIIGWTFVKGLHSNPWGQNSMEAGAIQATMVSALPLPPRQRTLDTGVLTSEKPSPAPVQTKEQTQPPPSPKDLAIPTKPTKPVKTAEKATPEPPKHVQPAPVQPTKAVTGETAGIRIAQATMQLKNGTASVSVQDRTFGSRFSYYVDIVNRKVAEQWFVGEADPRASQGKSVTIVFDINRDGVPLNPRIETKSGSPSLDVSALHALQRVDGFGPLPQGNKITVEYTFNYKLQN